MSCVKCLKSRGTGSTGSLGPCPLVPMAMSSIMSHNSGSHLKMCPIHLIFHYFSVFKALLFLRLFEELHLLLICPTDLFHPPPNPHSKASSLSLSA